MSPVKLLKRRSTFQACYCDRRSIPWSSDAIFSCGSLDVIFGEGKKDVNINNC